MFIYKVKQLKKLSALKFELKFKQIYGIYNNPDNKPHQVEYSSSVIAKRSDLNADPIISNKEPKVSENPVSQH